MSRTFVIVQLLALLIGCSPDRDGPKPKIESVTPSVICTAQGDTEVEIAGENFSPAVGDSLTDSPKILMPRVWLIDPSGNATEVPEANTVFVKGEGGPDLLTILVTQELVGPIEPGQPEVAYQIRVVNPNDNSDTFGQLVVVPPPRLDAVEPTSGAQGTIVPITLTGVGFREGMVATLDATPPVIAGNMVVVSSNEATADLDLNGVTPGVYSITVENVDGCSDTLENAFEVTEPLFFDLLGIDPPFGWTGAPTSVTIFSNGGFVSTPTVEMRPAGQADADPVVFERVAFIDADTLTAVVPAGAALGTYDVFVYNPPSNGQIGRLENGFRVVSQPVPLIVHIVPGRGTTQDDTPVTIYGENFRAPVRIELLSEDAAGDLQTAVTIEPVTPTSSTQIDTVFPTQTQSASLPVGPYLVRVTNTDEETYYTYSAFLVTNPAGNLNIFETTASMTTGRRMLAGAFGNDELGNRYLYAIGGDNGSLTTVYDTVELSQLSRFGALASWREQYNRLVIPRVGGSAVVVPVFDPDGSPFIPVRTYLYVIGGLSDAGDVLDSIERAVVLSSADAPKVTSELTAAGALDEGTWYYKVSAVLDASDPDNPGGETLASDEVIVTLGAAGAVTLTWQALEINGIPAASYRIYRTDEPNGTSQQEHRIDEVTATTYTDDGKPAGSLEPMFPGSTGVFVEIDGVLDTPRWGHQSVILHDDAGAWFVYTLGGKSAEQGGVVDTVEWAPLTDDGILGDASTSGATPMSEARAFFAAAVEDSDNVATFDADGSRLWAMGGIDSSGEPTGSLEESDVTTGGGNGAWTTNGKSVQSAAGSMAIIVNEKLFVLGGAASADDTTFGNITPNGRDTEFDEVGEISGSINSTANSLLAPRALGCGEEGAGFIYFYGGTSNGTDALTSVERTF